LEDAADTALQKAVEEVVRDIRVYFIVDISGSMSNAIERAKEYIAQFLQAFPLDRLHVSVFNTHGRELKIPHASKLGVKLAFAGISAGGGTDYGAGERALARHAPRDDEDSLFIFVGDEQASVFESAVAQSKLRPMAFGLVPVPSAWGSQGSAVRDTAERLGLPCFVIDLETFNDPYAIPRTLRHLVASTPVQVGQARN
ncbi:unnamed protein product, partial [Laminaria digitata]